MVSEMIWHHLEDIRCPKCKGICAAGVAHTRPDWTYKHTCEHCGRIIEERAWNVVEEFGAKGDEN